MPVEMFPVLMHRGARLGAVLSAEQGLTQNSKLSLNEDLGSLGKHSLRKVPHWNKLDFMSV